MSPSINMAFRGNNNRNRNFGGNYGGGPMAGGNNRMGMNMSPWDNQNAGGGNYGGGNMRQGGGGGGVGGGQGMNAQAINLANNLLNNLFRNQNPPSLLDLPRGGGGMAGNRNQRPGPMVNRAGPGNRNNQRRVQGGFNNRGGAKVAANKQGGGIRKQNAFDRAKKLLAKNSNKKKDSAPGENTENTKKNESQVKESPYANVPNDMFYCHLCKKHMWDANSFENHIKGRAHLMMREGIEESYRLRANMIRQEAKIAEQLKSVELDRLKRMGKSKNRNLEYCTMCDLNFHGHLSAHRKSDGHLQLKKFLHPKCAECNKEFSTRIDYDSHLLSADHLKKAAEKNTKVGERKKNTLTILTEEDELKDVRPPQKKKKKAAPAAGEVKKEGEEGAEKKEGEEESEEKKEGDEEAADETKEGDELNETKEEEEEEVALPEDGEDIIIDFNDGDDVPVEIDAKLPKYNWTRPVGASMITKLECYECSICGKFFDTEKTVEVHSRTVSHHRQFVKFLNDKSSDTKIAQKRAAAAIEETERKKRKIEEAAAAEKAEQKKEDEEEGGEGEGDAEVKEENGEEANDELYDPSEATGDDEDVDMAENGEKEVADEEMVEEENGDTAEPEEEEEEMETAAPEEVKEEPAPAKVEPKTPAPAVVAAAPATPTPAAAPAPAPAATTPTQASPPKKGAAAAKTPAAKATPRGRGRGRYSRY